MRAFSRIYLSVSYICSKFYYSTCTIQRFTNTAKLKDHLVLERRCSGEFSFSFWNSMRRIVAKTVCFVTLLNLYTHISIQYDFIIRINVRHYRHLKLIIYFLEFKNLIYIFVVNSKKNILLFPNHHKYNAVLIRNYLIFLDAVRVL